MTHRTAAILTCHNRKAKTIACIASLFNILPQADVYLTDDGCSDGTTEEIARRYPSVHFIKGDGNLFWSRGMYIAWREAIKGNYDYYLWLNDDVELYPDFWTELMTCEQLGGGICVISGLIENEDGDIIYGGFDKSKQKIQRADIPQPIWLMNGNVVLVPKTIVEQIGIIDPYYHHDSGDADYGLRVQEHGLAVLSTRNAIARGCANPICRVRKEGVTLKERFRMLNSPLGAPISISFYFRHKHFGLLNALAFCTHLIIINLLPDQWIKIVYGQKYIG